jgi:hypothetical protein
MKDVETILDIFFCALREENKEIKRRMSENFEVGQMTGEEKRTVHTWKENKKI